MEGAPNSKEIIGIRHLEDENALLSYGFDTPLKEGQEALVNEIADHVIDNSKKLGLNKIDFVFSTQKRTTSTANLVKGNIDSKNQGLEVSLVPDERLADLDQGKLIFPEGYKDGDVIPFLSKAWDAFWKESFSNNNLLYRFGDPLKGIDGTSAYPDLEGAFEELGESCGEFTYRIYDFLGSLECRDYGSKLNVIIAHTATTFILHEFVEIAKDLSKQFAPHIPMGDLPKISWVYFDRVKKYLPEKLSHGEISTYDITDLIRPEIQEIIRIERDVLKAKLVQSGYEK